ncbi:hypothetical protein D3C87_1821070 [compost metagenome]
MREVDDAKSHMSGLGEAQAGKPADVAKAGDTPAHLTSTQASLTKSRLGFLEGQFRVPEDFFDPSYDQEIIEMFEGEDETSFETGADLRVQT